MHAIVLPLFPYNGFFLTCFIGHQGLHQTSAAMEGAAGELTEIQQFYKNETVFLTGATGYLGKLMLEKVLRALPVKKLFLLIRTKRNVAPSARLQTLFESPVRDSQSQ